MSMAVNQCLVPIIIRKLSFFCLALAVVACNESRHLAPGQTLYTANVLKIQSSVKLSHHQQKVLLSELKPLVRPTLNSKLLGWRFRLWVYNVAGDTKKKKGFKHWLKYKLGEAPVLATPTLIEKNRQVLQNHLENKGYFQDTVLSATPVKNKHLTAVYTAQIGQRYTIRQAGFPPDSDLLSQTIDSLQSHSLLKKGDGYDLDVIKEERTRIDSRLKNRGYFYFQSG